MVSDKENDDRLEPLDFLRGTAILGVVAFHTFILFRFGGKVTVTLFSFGVYGVQLFFFVSALTMCLMWDRRIGENRAAVKFYVRRLFRIAPPFWLGIVGYLFLYGTGPSQWAPEGIGPSQIITTSLLVHPFWPSTVNAIVPGGWSIGVEVAFYSVFPLLTHFSANYRVYLLSALGIYFANLALVRPTYNWLLADYAYPSLVGEFLYFQLFNQAPIFLLGIALYKSSRTGGSNPVRWFGGIAFLWLVAAFSLKYIWRIPSSPFFWTIGFALLGYVVFVLKYTLTFPPINRFGQLSYSIYLLHFAVIYAVAIIFEMLNLNQHSVAGYALALSMTLALCWLLGTFLRSTVEKASAVAGRRIVHELL